MKTSIFIVCVCAFISCKETAPHVVEPAKQTLAGTWKLVSNTIITNQDTLRAFPVEGQEMIKMFNDSHFAFFRHDVSKGKTATPVFESGSGTYSLAGNTYEEHLTYCTSRDWEGHHFSFRMEIKNDSIIQSGTEKLDSLGINREIIEVYTRVE